jgi:hypothetical protein
VAGCASKIATAAHPNRLIALFEMHNNAEQRICQNSSMRKEYLRVFAGMLATSAISPSDIVGVSENRITQHGVGHSTHHRSLNGDHQFARLEGKGRESQDFVAVRSDQHL